MCFPLILNDTQEKSPTNPGFHSANCNQIFFMFCFIILAGAKIKMSLPLVPLQNAAPHGQSKQQLRPFLDS